MREIDIDNGILEPQDIRTSIDRVLLVEDQQTSIDELSALLIEALDTRFELVSCSRLDAALEKLYSDQYSLIIADLSLPDAQGPEVYSMLNTQAPHTPIIVTAEAQDEAMAVKAVQLGAQEYIIKSTIDVPQLQCTIKYALEQKAVQEELSTLALIDKATGLYNRPSFLTLTDHYLKLADRAQKGLIFLHIRLQNFYDIESAYGTHGAEKALVDSARILKQTFRRSDIISRYTDDEFAVVALETRKDCDSAILKRLQQNLEVHNHACAEDSKLKFSIGTAYYDSQAPVSLAELVALARRSQCHRYIKECSQ
ncbi:diguanylate cyclase [candidate division WOR-3 bacterium]|nr:diguanylate cyclase [candidate division WOR-3 bacterium]